MNQKNNLDKVTHLEFPKHTHSYINQIFKEVFNFNKESIKCKCFSYKPIGIKLSVAWCSELNDKYKYKNCPKINKKSNTLK